MNAALRAFYWECLRRRRWGFAVIALYLAALPFIPIDYSFGERFAFTVITPTTICVLYLIAIFSFGFNGDISARETLYPQRLLALPLSTKSLAVVPMLYGMVAIAALWLITAVFALQPANVYAPTVWPMVFFAAFMGWAQALTWLPYGWRNARVLAIAVWLTAIDTVGLLAIHFKPPTILMVALFAPQIPLVLALGYYAVGKARTGHVPAWGRVDAKTNARTKELQPFATAKAAHLWFEWQQHGRALFSLVAMLVPLELLLLVFADGSSGFVFLVLAIAALTPVFMAACTATTMRDALSTFIATRPMTSGELVATKLRVAFYSTLLTWAFVIACAVTALSVTHTWFAILSAKSFLLTYAGPMRAVALVAVALMLLMIATWRQLVQTLYIGLTGRVWLMKAFVMTTLFVLIALVPVGDMIIHSDEALRFVWKNLRWILAALVVVKMLAAAPVVTLKPAMIWVTAVMLLHGVFTWLLDTPHVPAYFTMAVAILSVPLARICAAPLALAWNRHR